MNHPYFHGVFHKENQPAIGIAPYHLILSHIISYYPTLTHIKSFVHDYGNPHDEKKTQKSCWSFSHGFSRSINSYHQATAETFRLGRAKRAGHWGPGGPGGPRVVDIPPSRRPWNPWRNGKQWWGPRSIAFSCLRKVAWLGRYNLHIIPSP